MIGEVHAPGATPLEPDEVAGLIPKHITTQRDLNEWEQSNIVEAVRWADSQSTGDVLTQAYLRELHRRMFDGTWTWAGRYRTSDKNIGVDWSQITDQTERLLGDARYWIEHGTWSPAECAVRFHHRLVWIHLFPNGNGRHARLCADILVSRLGAAPLTWGQRSSIDPENLRETYIRSLRAADAGDIKALVAFAQS
jgi:Fic-DOC domain mobile mystery protein B